MGEPALIPVADYWAQTSNPKNNMAATLGLFTPSQYVEMKRLFSVQEVYL